VVELEAARSEVRDRSRGGCEWDYVVNGGRYGAASSPNYSELSIVVDERDIENGV